MAFRFRFRRQDSVQNGLRKIATEQIDKAIAEIADDNLNRHEAVHQVRKRCKKVRGAIRIVRPCFDDYRRENAFLRDAAGALSDIRDAQSRIDCFDGLLEHFKEQLDRQVFASVREGLVAQRQEVIGDTTNLDKRLGDFHRRMQEVRSRALGWKIDKTGYGAIRSGLKKTYRRARRAMRDAYRDPSPEAFHEWRKRVKYHWYHVRLLNRIWPDLLIVQADSAHELSALLGDDHDLAVLRQTLRSDPEGFGDERDVRVVMGLIEQHSAELRNRADLLGRRVFAEKPSQFVLRFGSYWKSWRRKGAP